MDMKKLAASADAVLVLIADHFSGNAKRRAAMHRRATELGDEIRQSRWVVKHAKSKEALGLVPQGYRVMLNTSHKNYISSI